MFHLFSQLSHFCHKIPHFTISRYTTFLPPFLQRGIFFVTFGQSCPNSYMTSLFSTKMMEDLLIFMLKMVYMPVCCAIAACVHVHLCSYSIVLCQNISIL